MIEKKNDDEVLDNIQGKLDSIIPAKTELRQMWVERTLELDQSLELQRFYADYNKMKKWKVPYNIFTGQGMENDTKFDAAIREHEHDIKAIEESADELVKGKHYAALEISERKETMMAKCQVFRT